MNANSAIILFVDDEKICHTLFNITATNFHLVGAFSAKEAISLAEYHAKDLKLVVADILLPDMNSYDLMDIFQKNHNLAKIPFLLQTGLSPESGIIKNNAYRNLKILYKPYKAEELLSCMDTFAALFL